MSEFFTPDFKALPYWWERKPRPRLPQMPLPVSVDVAVVGSGYTGLCAALELARGGRSVLALDAADVGWGCSSRNGGQIRSEEHTSELQSLMRTSYAFFCLKKKNNN